MALYSVHIGTVQRGKGENAIATAAYNARDKLTLQIKDKLTNITTDITWDYRSKGGLAYSRIYAPQHAPDWVYDREKLWNEVERAENRCDAQIARKGVIALPRELTEEQNIAMLEEIYADEIKRGMVVDLNIHNDKEGNPHAHPLVTMRELVKNRYGEYEFSRIKDRYIQSRQYVRDKREVIANVMNKHLALNGHEVRVSHLSYKAQGIDLLPTLHEGPARNINQSELVAANIEIAKENAKRIEERPGIILDKLVINSPVFTKEDVAKELEARLSATINWQQIENVEEVQAELSERFTALYEQIMNGSEIELVVESDLKDRTLYTTAKRLKLEERYEENIRVLASNNNHSLGITEADLDSKSLTEIVSDKIKEIKSGAIETINKHTPLELEKSKGSIKLSPEQRKAVLGLVNGADVAMLEGLPGAGKTTVMREVVRQCRKQGYKVIGIATSSSAALELEKATGIECKNASLWRKAWQQERGREFELNLRADYYKEEQYQDNDNSASGNKNLNNYFGDSQLLSDKHIVLLDEASMVELANMDYLVSEVRAAGAKIIKIGDNNQLSAVGYQGAALKTSEIVGSEKLTNTRRQKNPEHREATKLLARYRIRSALDIYWNDGSIKLAANEAESNSMCADAFVKRYINEARITGRDDLVARGNAAILVYENDTRRLLNDQVREQLHEAGVIKGEEYNLCVGALRKDKNDEKSQKDAPAQANYRIALEKVINHLGESIDSKITLEQKEDIAYDLCRFEYKELGEKLAKSVYQKNYNKISRTERKSIEQALRTDISGDSNNANNYRQHSLMELSDLAKSEREVNAGVHYIKLRRGEQVVFKRNENRLGKKGIYNGELGTVLGVRKFKQDGFGVVDILVHKADGRREKITLDLRAMSKGAYFYEDISLDYGYAITAHTAQGADITHTINKFGAGYEVNNVNLTRHVKSTEIIVNREQLEDAWYESLDENARAARNRFDINKEESSEKEVLRGGLVRLVSKRVNNSFAGSYKDIGLLAEDKILKSYIDKSGETIVTFRKLTSWQQQQLRKTGTKLNLWKNKELWQEFLGLRQERNKTALIIKSCYEDYKPRLVQMQMNYATIERHASQADIRSSDKDNKVVYQQKNSILHEQTLYKELVEAVSSGNSLHIRKVYHEVEMEIEGRKSEIQSHMEEIAICEEQQESLLSEINRELSYRKLLMPEYLDRIYSRPKNSVENGEDSANHKNKLAGGGADALVKYDDLVLKYGSDLALNMVVKNPSLLGKFKGVGFGRMVAFGNKRKDVIELCKGLERQFTGYNGAGKKLEELEAVMEERNYSEEISSINTKIESLRALLPADIDKEFLTEVGSRLNIGQKLSSINEIDWRSLQESELFDAVRIHQITKKQEAYNPKDSEVAVTFKELKTLAAKQQDSESTLYSRNAVEEKFEQHVLDTELRNNKKITVDRIIADPKQIIDRLDYNKSVFTSYDIEAEIDRALKANIDHIKRSEYIEDEKSLNKYIKTEKQRILDSVLISSELKVVNACDLRGRTLFARTSQIELEKRFISNVQELHSKDDHAILINNTDIKPLGKDKNNNIIDYTVEQKQLIKNVLGGRNISIIEGWPGAGKSTVAKEIIRHYQERDYQIIAVAPTNKAAQELGDKLNCKSYTAAALRMKWQFDRGHQANIALSADYYKEEAYQDSDTIMTNKTLLIMDEISMLDMPTFDYFTVEMNRSGGKIIGIGDNNQNQAIGMKGAAGKAIEIVGSNLLTEINRHKNSDTAIRKSHIDASIALSNYEVPKALAIYNKLEAIKLADTEELKEQAIFSSYIEKLVNISVNENIDISTAATKIAMIAYTNAEISRLNMMVRSSLKRSGFIAKEGGKFLSSNKNSKGNMVELCVGDRIIFKSTQKEEDGYGGVMNNETATIRKIVDIDSSGRGEFVADVDHKGQTRTVVIRTGEGGISFRHAYAITNYAVQGSSIDHVLLSIDKHSGYEVTLVGLTRHIKTCKIFAAQNTLENEVYRTKDLDVEKVIEEYKAISYKVDEREKSDNENDETENKAPLWLVGLHLLASKRSNLNFAIDYKYGNNSHINNESLASGYSSLKILRDDLNKHANAISKFESQSSDKINTSINSDNEINREKYSQIESKILQNFDLDAGDVVLNARGIINSPKQYMLANADDVKLQEHLESLKGGKQQDGQTFRFKWKDLRILDQNLLIYSYLSDKEKNQLILHIERSKKLERQITQVSSDYASILHEISNITEQSHEDLQGNYSAVRDYLEARVAVKECYRAFMKTDSILTTSKIQKLLLSEIQKKYGINFKSLDIKINSISKAEQNFLTTKKEFDTNQIQKNSDFKPIEDIDQAREDYLLNIINSNQQELINKNKILFAVDTLKQTKNPELLELSDRIETVKLELEEAKGLREEKALSLIKDYNDVQAADSNEPSIAKLFTQLNLNYQTVAKHARVAEERHYFEEISKSSFVNNKHYGKLMLLIDKANSHDLTEDDIDSVLESHHKLLTYSGKITEDLIRLKTHKNSTIEEKNKEPKTRESKVLADNIKRYVEGNEEMVTIQEKVENDYYNKKLRDIDTEITSLKGQLANSKELAIIKEINKIEFSSTELYELNNKKFISNINRLFKEERALDLSFNWHGKRKNESGDRFKDQHHIENNKKAGESNLDIVTVDELRGNLDWSEVKIDTKSKTNTKQNTDLKKFTKNTESKNNGWQKKIQQPRIEYKDVRAALDSGSVESIFRYYVPLLNPDDEIKRRGNEMVCGSLHMNCGNSHKIGMWMRHSSNDGGDIFKFVQNATGKSKKEALEIVGSFVGITPTMDKVDLSDIHRRVEVNNSIKDVDDGKLQDKWVPNNKVPADAPKFKPEKHLKYQIEKGNKITLVHEYRSINNQLLGYTVRMENASGKKQVLPVAWCTNEVKGKSTWVLKGFASKENKPIYGANKLGEDKLKPILIVEGEKTADKAQELLPDYIVISWIGGAAGINKVCWQQVQDRVVTIWPDNDQPGITAANKIREHIDNHNGFSGIVSIIDTKKLNLPEKWDLADQLPEHLINNVSGRGNRGEIAAIESIITETQKEQYQPSANKQSDYSAGLNRKVDMHYIIVREDKSSDIEQQLDKRGGYLSKSMYSMTLAAIAKNESVDLSDQNNYANNMCKLKDHYSRLHWQYNNQQQASGKREKIENVLIRDVSILHKVLLQRDKLLPLHSEAIESTVKIRVEGLKKLSDADIRYVADNIYKETLSGKWIKNLNKQNIVKTNEFKESYKDQRAKERRNTIFERHSHQIDSLRKIDTSIDYDQLANKLYSMSMQDQKEYVNSLIVEETRKYIAPLLAKHAIEKEQAKNIKDLMVAIEKEYITYLHLNKEHKESVYAVDQKENKANMKLFLQLTAASDIDKQGGFIRVQKLIEHVIEHKISRTDKIIENLKDRNTNLRRFAEDLHRTCKNYHKQEIDKNIEALNKNIEVSIGHNKFKNPIAYLDHIKNHYDHNHIPLDHINKHMQYIENNKQQDTQKDLHMSGPSL